MKARPSDPPIKKIVFTKEFLASIYGAGITFTWEDEEVDAEHLDEDCWLVLAKPGPVYRLRANIVRVKGKKVLEILGKPH